MSESETAEFEARMIQEPALAADVNVRQRIRAGLSLLEERGELGAMLEEQKPRMRSFRYAAAAAVAVLALSSAWFLWLRGAGGAGALLTAGEAGNAGAAPTYLLAQLRGPGDATPVAAPAGAEVVVLQLLADGTRGDTFDARLERESAQGARVIGERPATLDASGYVVTYVRVSGLEAGRYVIHLVSKRADQPEQSFGFELSRPRP